METFFYRLIDLGKPLRAYLVVRVYYAISIHVIPLGIHNCGLEQQQGWSLQEIY